MFGFGKRPKTEAESAAASAAASPDATPDQALADARNAASVTSAVESPKAGFFSRLKAGLSRTRDTLANSLGSLLLGKKAIDQELLDELETRLLTSDVGTKATASILGELTEKLKRNELADSDALYAALKQLLQVAPRSRISQTAKVNRDISRRNYEFTGGQGRSAKLVIRSSNRSNSGSAQLFTVPVVKSNCTL